MIKQFRVVNYKNFEKEIALDFSKVGGYQFNQDCLYQGHIGKMLIYGRNAVGKTNFGHAMMDIFLLLRPFREDTDAAFLNANSKIPYAGFTYVFQFDVDCVTYEYQKGAQGNLLFERLLLNEKEIFCCDYRKATFHFEGLAHIQAETALTERFVDTMHNKDSEEYAMAFLNWMFGNVALSSDSALLKLRSFLQRMYYVSNLAVTGYMPKRVYARFFESLADEKAMKHFEHFMQTMGVKGSYTVKKLPDGEWELYFKYNRLLPFRENASSGTVALMNLYRRLVVGGEPAFVFMDEFDAFYHYEMAFKLLQFFKEEFTNCQMIFTTHNTNLMSNQLSRPDCIFIMSTEGRLTPLCDATMRELREGHNLEKMFISGEFERYE